MPVKDDEFKGNLLSYLEYRRNKRDKFFDKYSKIIDFIEELQNNKSKVNDHDIYDSQDNLSTNSNIHVTEGVHHQINKPSFQSSEVEKIYDDLKNAIDNVGSVENIIKNNEQSNIQKALCVNKNGKGPLIIYALKNNVEVLKEIFSDKKCSLYMTVMDFVNRCTLSPHSLIGEAIYYSATRGDIDTIKNAKDFIDQSPKSRSCLYNILREKFTHSIEENDITLASKMYPTCKSAGITAFRENSEAHYLFYVTHLADTLSVIERGDDSFLRNTLNFAKENNLLTDVFQRDCHHGKNLLQYAQEQGVKTKVEKIIKECGIDSTKYTSINMNSSLQAGSHSFLQKHSGKMVVGTIGVGILAISVLAFACAVNNFVALGLALVGLAMILCPLLAVTTNKGEKMWNTVSNKLSVSLSTQSSQSNLVTL